MAYHRCGTGRMTLCLYGGIDEPETKIIDVFICKLRKRLIAVGFDCLIATVYGRDYTLRPIDEWQRETGFGVNSCSDEFVAAVLVTAVPIIFDQSVGGTA